MRRTILASGVLVMVSFGGGARASVTLPPENRAGYDALCRNDWTKRGVLDEEMYDYCMRKMHNGYAELVEEVDKYKDAVWIQNVVDYAVGEWTKRDTRDDEMVAHEVKKQEEGFEDLAMR